VERLLPETTHGFGVNNVAFQSYCKHIRCNSIDKAD